MDAQVDAGMLHMQADAPAPVSYRVWQHLRDGFFLDDSTAQLKLRLALLNAESSTFVSWTLDLHRRAAGSFIAFASFHSLPQLPSLTLASRASRIATAMRHMHQRPAQVLLQLCVLMHSLHLATAALGLAPTPLEVPRSMLAATAAIGVACLLLSAAVAIDWAGAHAAAAAYTATPGAQAPTRTLLAAYHDISAPARMLMPAKQGVAPLSVAVQPQAADNATLQKCSHLSASRARDVTVQAGPPVWSLPDDNTELNRFTEMLVRLQLCFLPYAHWRLSQPSPPSGQHW